MSIVTNLTALEHDVMGLLLQGDDDVLRVLREQLLSIRAVRREFSGAGFYTYFVVSDDAPKVRLRQSFNFGDVIGDLIGLQNGAGFVLFVKDGTIDFLEAYCYDEPWPSNIEKYSLKYNNGSTRNLQSIRAKWS